GAVTNMPELPTAVIAPPPDVKRRLAAAPSLEASVIAPAPNVSEAVSRQAVSAPQAAVIAPPPSVQQASSRRISDITIGRSEAVALAPQLPMGEHRAMSRMAQAGRENPGAAAAPPPPSIQGAGSGTQSGRMIALNLHPAAPSGPVTVPNGNRRGTF